MGDAEGETPAAALPPDDRDTADAAAPEPAPAPEAAAPAPADSDGQGHGAEAAAAAALALKQRVPDPAFVALSMDERLAKQPPLKVGCARARCRACAARRSKP